MKNRFVSFFIIVIMVILVLTGLAFWFYQRQNFSQEILKLEVLGPETIQTGQEAEYTVKYKNNGNVRLEDLELVFQYPEGSLLVGQESDRVIKELGDLYPGQEELFQFQARIFGRPGEIKTAQVSLSYHPKNLQATYESKSSFSSKLEEIPLVFGFDFPSKVTSGKELKLSLNYFSNLDFPIFDLRVKLEYPAGFEFVRANPAGIERNEWEIEMLNRAEGGRIEIFGKVLGEVASQKVFKAQLGIWLRDNFIPLKEISRGVEIVRPRLAIFQTINGSADYIINPGDFLHYEIIFRNLGQEPLEDLFLFSSLSGPFDFESLRSALGRPNPSDRSVVWESRSLPQLQFLAPGEEGRVDFWIELKKDWEIKGPTEKNPVVRNKISFLQGEEEFSNKINSRLSLSQAGYFQNEIFDNSGPLPPRVDQKTTYTIIWSVKNSFNDLSDAKVRAFLAPGVRLTGKIFPEEEQGRFTFDSVSGEVLWNVGEAMAGMGIFMPSKTIAFQVALVPLADQKGQLAELISQATFSGEDLWTEMNLQASAQALNTSLPDDPTMTPDKGIVQ